ncbi:MAG: helix-turn-helix transcriptional regulator [Longimicrobiales bacterium]|nr:helix-turn-helix transcriptional regulator [Longimicrobiales bacterium]
MAKETLGEFEVMVLLAALRLGEEAYGLSIAEEIEATAGRSARRASVYVTLRRLEKKGLISTHRESQEEAPSGKPRRFVRVKPEAVALVRASRQALQRMWSGLEDVLEEA